MNLSRRSRLSLCQFVDLFNRDSLVVLFEKHGLRTGELLNQWGGTSVPPAVREAVLTASAEQIGNILAEALRTHGALRYQISPKYRFDERWNDLLLYLELDGYRRGYDEYGRETDTFVPSEPTIRGVQAIEDDLAAELQQSGLPDASDIARVIEKLSRRVPSQRLQWVSRKCPGCSPDFGDINCTAEASEPSRKLQPE